MKRTRLFILCLIISLLLTSLLFTGCKPSGSDGGVQSGGQKDEQNDGSEQSGEQLKDFHFDGNTLYRWSGRTPYPVIPEKSTEGKTVTQIGKGVFRDLAIRSITLPKTIDKIEADAFKGCDSLEAVYFEGTIDQWCSITFVGGEESNPLAAGNSVKLFCQGEEIVGDLLISGSIEEIKPYALYKYSAITSLTLSEGIKSVGDYSFANSTKLESLNLPSTLEAIGKRAFGGSSITALRLPDSLKSIDAQAFDSCQALETVEFGSNLNSIGQSAFAFCRKLQSFTLPQSLMEIKTGAFSECSSITSFSLPEGVTRVSVSLLSGCKSLTEITLHDGVSELGERAFISCSSLEEISIPSGISVIPDSAFQYCISLKTINLHENIKEIGNFAFYNCAITELNLSDSTTKIGKRAFAGCNSLTDVKIHGIVEIPDEALIFESCTNIKSAKIPTSLLPSIKDSGDKLERLVLTFGNLSLDSISPFTSLTSLTLPSNIESISKGSSSATVHSLYYPENLSDWAGVSIDFNLSEVAEAFYVNQTNVYLDGDLSLIINEGEDVVGEYQFAGFKCLGSVTLPAGVTKISNYAFLDCSNIHTLNFLGTTEDWCGVKIDILQSSPLYYDAELRIKGQPLPSRLVIGSEVIEVNNGAFINQGRIEELVIESNDTYVGISAFSGCNNIRYAEGKYNTLASFIGTQNEYPSLKSVYVRGERSFNFSNCPNLADVRYEIIADNLNRKDLEGTSFFANPDNWTDGVLYIGNVLLAIDEEYFNSSTVTVREGTLYIAAYAMEKSSITGLSLPEGLLSIGQRALMGSSIIDLVLPTSLKKLGYYACKDMKSLRSLTIGENYVITEYQDTIFEGVSVVELVNKTDYYGYQLEIDYFFSSKKKGEFFTTDNGIYYYSYIAMGVIPSKHIISYSGNETELDLSSYTSMADSVFCNNTYLEKVTIGAQTVSAYAFYGCTSLKSVTLLESVDLIEFHAFDKCGYISEVIVKNCSSIHFYKEYVNPMPGQDIYESTSNFQEADENHRKFVEVLNSEIARQNEIRIKHFS